MLDQSPPSRSRRAGLFAPIALILIVLLGGYLRFNGLNWDDFSALHPDERFLTLNLLPLVGGNLEMTDDKQFPSQVILVSASSPYTGRFELETNSTYRIGAIQDTLSAEVAAWTFGQDRVITYPTPEEALSRLLNSEVLGLVAPEADSGVYGVSVRTLEVIGSTSIQLTRCQNLYPETNGAGGYFDAKCSPLNPHNAGAGFYAYGTLPLFIAHFASDFVQENRSEIARITGTSGDPATTYYTFQYGPLIWRFFSAFFDVGTIFLVFLIAMRMHHYKMGLLAALIYAAMPLAVEKAHYGTVNAITTFFVALGLWAALRVQDKGRWFDFIVFGIALGAAVSGRINTAPLAAIVVLAALVYSAAAWDSRLAWSTRRQLILRSVFGVMLAGVVSLITFRLCNPYAFQGPGIFGILPNPRFFADLASAQFGISGSQDSPPNWQWMSRPAYLFPLKDMLLWGMGIAAGGLAWFGALWTGYRLFTGKPMATRNLLIWVWTVAYFAWMGRQWVMTMRYYLPMYPAMAVLAAWTAYECVRLARERGSDIPLTRILLSTFGVVLALIPTYYIVNGFEFTFTAGAAGIVAAGLLVVAWLPGLGVQRSRVLVVFTATFTVLWGLMFSNIYRHQLTRVQAARYVWEQMPGDFSMKIEGAPEGTPLVNMAIFNTYRESSLNPDALARSATRLMPHVPSIYEFTASASGTITQVYAPHLGDDENDPDPETLYISLAEVGAAEPLATGTLSIDFQRANNVLGEPYTIPFSRPVTIEKDKRYSLKVEAMDGTIITAGPVVVTEGDWDDRITTTKACTLPDGKNLKDDLPPGIVSFSDCNGLDSSYALVNSYDQAMSYPVDDDMKLSNIIESLNAGDYIAITSNRFYDTENRNRLRWPLSSRYYDLLFSGQLGYDVDQVFTESYELGPLSVSDQHLPIYNSPTWFNEYEADEAFHVYDHPAVFLLKKRADYDPQRVEFLMRSVPILQANNAYADPQRIGAQIIGVVYWESIVADAAPTGLMLSPDQKAIQQLGGTWRERFDSGSILNMNQPVGVAAWWLLIIGFGWLAFPITFTIFPGLTDRGYSVAKFVGILLVSWMAWVLASVRIPMWSQSGLILCTAFIAALSLWLAWRKRSEFTAHIRSHLGQMMAIEVLGLVLFLAFVGVRLTNPDLWHDAKGGEKPMDFAMFNAVLRSTTFPPYDAWFSGGFINYYYFGYVFVGAPVLLLKIMPSIAYNLVIPTLFALTGLAVFGAAFNLVAYWRDRPRTGLDGIERQGARRGSAWVAGISAVILCIVLGNLDTLRVFGIGLANLGGYHMPTGIEASLTQQYVDANGMLPPPEIAAEYSARATNPSIGDKISYEVGNSLSVAASLARGLQLASQGRELPLGSDRWYWSARSVLMETPGVEGNAITEMPYFAFVYGDLHAHMMSMSFMLFAIVFVWHELAVIGEDRRSWRSRLGALAIGAMVTGLLRAVNTWDWPTFTALSILGLGYAWWLRWEKINRASIVDLLAQNSVFMVINAAVALPFTTWFASNYNSIELWQGGKSPLWAYIDIHGVFLFFVFCLLLWETGRWLRSVKVKALRGRFIGFSILLLLVLGFLFIAVGGLFVGYQVALFVIPMVMWGAILFFRPGQNRAMQFVLVLICLALTLTLFVEVIVLTGDIGRQNTVFKFYIQVWMLLSVACGAAIAWLLQASEGWTSDGEIAEEGEWSLPLKALFYLPSLVLVLVAAMYPIMATRARSIDRMTPDLPLTLNGLDYMQGAQHSLMDYGNVITLRGDYALIRWLQENVDGSPVIMEGRSLASEYRWNGRIAINTGLPSVLGWNFHERQQRTLDPLPRVVEQREQNIKFFYNTATIIDAVRILRAFDVTYIIVSDMERVMTTPEGIAKFDQMVDQGLLTVAFQDGDSVIYKVNPDTLERYAFAQYQQGFLP